MNLRLSVDMEKELDFFAKELHSTKTELVKPYIVRLLEDLEDYYYAKKALSEGGRTYSTDEMRAMLDVEG